jgi:hypothetical protein
LLQTAIKIGENRIFSDIFFQRTTNMSEDNKGMVGEIIVEEAKGAKSGWSNFARPSKQNENKADFLSRSIQASKPVHEVVDPVDDEVVAIDCIPDAKEQYSLEDKILFYKERECLLLLLEARKALATMILRTERNHEKKHIERRLKEESEKKKAGKLTVQEIQEMLQSSPDEDYYDIASGEFITLIFFNIITLTLIANLFQKNRNSRVEKTVGYFSSTKSQTGKRLGKTR